jgi:hypothetical protein
MDWPADTAIILLLFEGSSNEVQWSLRFPPSLPKRLEDGCVRRFVAARSMMRAFFPHWNPESRVHDTTSSTFAGEDVERVACEGNTVLTALPLAGNSKWLFGTFVHCPAAQRPDMRFLVLALLDAASVICSKAHAFALNSEGAVDVEPFEVLRSVLAPDLSDSRISPGRRGVQFTLRAFAELAELYGDTHFTLLNERIGDEAREQVPLNMIDSGGGTVLSTLRSNVDDSWFQSCCVLRAKDGAVMHCEGMQIRHARILSWYFTVVGDAERLIDEGYEHHGHRRLRAWVRQDQFVLCLDAWGSNGTCPQVQVLSPESDRKLAIAASKVLLSSALWDSKS